MTLPTDFLERLAAIAAEAGRIIMRHYADGVDVRHKDDRSPVTAADEEAETHILAALARNFPDIPVISEEASANGIQPEVGAAFFLVDPLDGTREFISKNGEFTVNIALIRAGAPVAGVVYAPALSALYGGSEMAGSWLLNHHPQSASLAMHDAHRITARPVPPKGLIAVASRSHRDAATDQWLAGHDIADFRAAGSSLKFCLLAEGKADVYPRLGRTMEWDTAAGHAVLVAAGGTVETLTGAPLAYGKRADAYANPHFVAWGQRG
ncbi:MAG TPA: 3'(2'),5'-bisphosphate nucleotidase CysQ [Micropepsaceae bacterium]|nr:3'(2'),5'-bisphosphate nucleotidase CysQ [Micropepsaceae bacterium]